IAQRTHFTGTDILILLLIYLAIIVIRAFVVMMFYPLMRRIGYGLPVEHGIVAWWGGLRGAIGLALALIVAGIDSIDPEIRNQILFLTAGIVFLTSTINATTTKWVVNALGITKMSSAKELILLNTQKIIRQSSEKELSKIKNDRFMAGANWEKVKEYIPEPVDEQREQELEIETLAETRKRILQKEKSSYWKQFEEGLLGRGALHQLSDTIDIMMDSEGSISLSNREDLENLWQTPKFWNKLQLVPVIGKFAQHVFFNKLSMSYDCARGFVAAQEENLKMVSSMAIHAEDGQTNERYEMIESEINENRIQGLTFLRNLREAYPEIYSAIETRQAIRTLLNHQEYSIERPLKQRRVEPDEAEGMLADIEEKMAKLLNTPPGIKTKLPVDMLRSIPWLAALDEKSFKKVLGAFQTRIYAVGENLVRKKRYGDDIFIIIRGSVKVIINKKVVDVLGPGDVLGEMSILAGVPRTATVTAESPVTALRLPETIISDLMKESVSFKYQLWLIAARRFTENLIEHIPPYADWSHQQIRGWLQNGEIKDVAKGQGFDLAGKLALLIYGQVVDAIDASKVFDEMQMVDSAQVKVIEDARFFLVDKA
ncbi:MAG: cyclic nucleotide-binding domain-containing protein, partial [Bacteroidota bacterium]